jgi:hypothetical protein
MKAVIYYNFMTPQQLVANYTVYSLCEAKKSRNRNITDSKRKRYATAVNAE